MATTTAEYNPFTEQAAGRYFVGREEQLRQFSRALVGLRAGQPRHMIVEGTHGTGKTSFLVKLVELAHADGLLSALPTLDPTATGRQHVCTILQSLISSIEDAMSAASAQPVRSLSADWERGSGSSRFRIPRTDRLLSDDLRADLDTIQTLASEAGHDKIVLCIDEGQRVEPFALSAVKNAFQHHNGFLVILSLRLTAEADRAPGAGRRILDAKAREAEDDFGASRFFVGEVPIGAFESDRECGECLVKRLEGNSISFDSDVLALIGRVTERHPADIIALASRVYDVCAAAQRREADEVVFTQAFALQYRSAYLEAMDLCASLSWTARTVLAGLLEFDGPAGAREVTQRLTSSRSDDVPEQTPVAVQNELGALVRSGFVRTVNDSFAFPDAVSRYAISVALRSS